MDIKIEDLQQVHDIHTRIEELHSRTELDHDTIERLLKPFEDFLIENGVNLNEQDL